MNFIVIYINVLPSPLSLGSPETKEKKCRTGNKSSSRKKVLTKSGLLTNSQILDTNKTKLYINKVYLLFYYILLYYMNYILNKYRSMYIPYFIALLKRALRNRSDQIDILSTQVIEKISQTHQSTKARIFQKKDSCSKTA